MLSPAVLDEAAAAGPTWCARLGRGADVWTGPAPAFSHGMAPTVSVAVLAADLLGPPDSPGPVFEVTETGAGCFEVQYHPLGQWRGVWHPVGRNWVLSRPGPELGRGPSRAHWAVTRSKAWPQTWVHVRFVLRHLVTAHLIERAGSQVVHAVAARRRGEGGVVLFVGPSRSGKTRLANRLIADRALLEVVEDDCGVVAQGRLVGLFPTEHELRGLWGHDISAVVALDQGATTVTEIGLDEASEWTAACPVPWPAAWLPGAPARPSAPTSFPAGTTCLRAPARSEEDDGVVAALREALAV